MRHLILSRLGFDLAGQEDPRLWRGMLFSSLGAVTDALPWALLAAVPALASAGLPPLLLGGLLAGLTVAGLVIGCAVKTTAMNDNFSATYQMVSQTRLRLANHLTRIPAGRILSWRQGALADLLTARFGLYQDIITHVWGLIVAGVAFPLLLWGLLLWLDWRLAVVQALSVPLAFLSIPWSYRLLDRAGAAVTGLREQAVVAVTETAAGARDLAFFDPARTRRAHAHATLDRLRQASMKTEAAPAPALTVYGLLLNLGLVAVIATAVLTLPPEAGSTAALPVAISLLIALRLTAALGDVAAFLAELRFSRSVLAGLRAVAAETALPLPARGQSPAGADLCFEDVHFSHHGTADGAVPPGGRHETLCGISVALPAGSITALVGPSGAGKTTLALLAARLWDVDSGAIRIGGTDLRAMDEATLNRTVSMVLQDVSLFGLSVRDNIRLGRPDAPQAEVEAAAMTAAIHSRILTLPEGYDTVLTPAVLGQLSGGEQQRLAIARAVLKDAPVLILDEATASLDLDSETQVREALSALCRGRTVLVIAHRLWTIRDADRILVLDGGRLREQGPHAGLLARQGLYARMWQAQTGEGAPDIN